MDGAIAVLISLSATAFMMRGHVKPCFKIHITVASKH